ncbi:unnamed protein product [Ostreobium quekettii]|uniref:SAP domain-containing protein n=1 Tax=Ostreobium quekettii TaxID=121088 RepID=A0A8S1J489_9CHLO|nr:unnamed protein product [Ostreobium quekettii]
MDPPRCSTPVVARCLGGRALGASLRGAASGGGRPRRPVRRLVVVAGAGAGSGAAPVSKTGLRKLPKAELAKQLSNYGLDSSGTKPQLVDRLLEHLKAADGLDEMSKDGQDDPSIVPTEQELIKKTKAELVEICKASGLAVRGTKAALVARILEHAEESLQPDWLGVPAVDGAADPARGQAQDAELVTKEEYAAQREELKAALLQTTKVQLQQMCIARGLKKSANTKLELAERLLQAMDEQEEEELREESEADIAQPQPSSQIEAPPGVTVEEGEEITRIVDFRDLTKEDMPVYIGDMNSEIDIILEEMRQTYGKYLTSAGGTSGFLEPETAFPVGGVDADEGPTDDDLRALESEPTVQEYSSRGPDLLEEQDVGDDGEAWSEPAFEELDAPVMAQPSLDTTSIGDEDARRDATIRLDDDENGIDDDDLESEGFGVVSSEGVSPDILGEDLEEEEQELQLRSRRRSRRLDRERDMEAKLLDLSGLKEEYPYDDDELEKMVDASYLQESDEDEEDADEDVDEEDIVDGMLDAEFADAEGDGLRMDDLEEDSKDAVPLSGTQLDVVETVTSAVAGEEAGLETLEEALKLLPEDDAEVKSTEEDASTSEAASAVPDLSSPVAPTLGDREMETSDKPELSASAVEEAGMVAGDASPSDAPPQAPEERDGGGSIPSAVSESEALSEVDEPVNGTILYESPAAAEEVEEGGGGTQPSTDMPAKGGVTYQSPTPVETEDDSPAEIFKESPTAAETVEGSQTSVGTLEESSISVDRVEEPQISLETAEEPPAAAKPLDAEKSLATSSQLEATEELSAAAKSAAGVSDAATLQAEVVQGKKMIETLQEQISARKEALTQMQERIEAAESTQQYTVAQMERLLLVAENLKTQRTDWQSTMRGKVDSLKEAAQRIHETEQTKAALASNLDELEEQLQDLEKQAKEKDKEAEKLKEAINSQEPEDEEEQKDEEEEEASSSAGVSEGSSNEGKGSDMTPGVAMAAGVLGFLDIVSSIFGDTPKKGSKERRKSEEEDKNEDS